MKKKEMNSIRVELPARSQNESLARQIICSFAAAIDPTLEELGELRIIISEAVTNCVVHAYRGTSGDIYISASLYNDRTLKIKIKDRGCGIDDIEKCMEPFYTTDEAGERGGMGFAIMKELSDSLSVHSKPGRGTTVTLVKAFGAEK